MDSIQGTTTDFRTPEKWNSVQIPARVAERAYTRVDKQEDGCWISQYSVANHGYAQIGWAVPIEQRRGRAKNEMVLAHRAAWTHVNGAVPLSMTLDHLCKVRRCVNPDHLRLLPNYENARRIDGKDWPMGTCINGHPSSELVPVTRRSKSGEARIGRICRKCRAIYGRRWIERHPEQAKAMWAAGNAKRDEKRRAASNVLPPRNQQKEG